MFKTKPLFSLRFVVAIKNALRVFAHFLVAFYYAAFCGSLVVFTFLILSEAIKSGGLDPRSVLGIAMFGTFATLAAIYFALPAFLLGYLATLALHCTNITQLWKWIASSTAVALLSILLTKPFVWIFLLVSGPFAGFFAWRSLGKKRNQSSLSAPAPGATTLSPTEPFMSGEKAPSQQEVKKLRRYVWIFLIVSIVTTTLGGLTSFYKKYNPDSPYKQARRISKDPMAVTRHVRINGVDLWIPVPYFHSRIPLEGDQNTVLLQTMYPDFLPLRKRPEKLWKEGEWYRNVRWLIQNSSKMKSLSGQIETARRSYKATRLAGEEYGLSHYTQPVGPDEWKDDFWLEGSLDNPLSLIRCSEKTTYERSTPQCHLTVWRDGLRYDISYDKRLLPHWRQIKSVILALTDQFQSNASFQPSTPVLQGD